MSDERLTNKQVEDWIEGAFVPVPLSPDEQGQISSMAHELIAARARLAELEAENARLRGDNMGDDIARADRFSKWKKQVANGARVCVRCGGANLALNIDGGASHDWFCNDCLEYGNWEDND